MAFYILFKFMLKTIHFFLTCTVEKINTLKKFTRNSFHFLNDDFV